MTVVTQLVKREEVITKSERLVEYTPIEKTMMDSFLPLSKFKYPGQAYVKDRMVRGCFNSCLLAMERGLRGPLNSTNPEAVPLEELVEQTKREWSEHMSQFKTEAQAINHPQTSRLRRNVDFAASRYKAIKDLQNAYKTVFYQLYGDAWQPTSRHQLQEAVEEYNCEDAVKEFFKTVPVAATSMQHGISGGGKVAVSKARARR